MSDSNTQDLPEVIGLDVRPPEESKPEPESKPLPDKDSFPAPILTNTKGEGLVIACGKRVSRVSKKGDPNYGQRKPGAKVRLGIYAADSTNGAVTGSAGNQFGVMGADLLDLDLIEAILANADEVQAMVDWTRENS